MHASRSVPTARPPASLRRAAATALVLALLVGCGAKPDEMLSSAKDYIARNDLNAAVIQLKNALQEDSKLAEARFLLGKIHLEQGDIRGAVKELERAAEFGYAADELAPYLAKALVRTAEFDRVIKDFGERTLADSAAQAQLLSAVGDARLAKADVSGARKTYEAALAANVDDAEARLGLGRAKLFAGDLAGAREEAQAVIAREPDQHAAHALLADTFLAEGRTDDALQALEEAVRIRPAVVNYHFALVSLLLQNNRTEQAAQRLEAMKKAAPRHPSTRYLQAFVDFRENRLTEARDGVLQAIKDAPEYLPAQLLAGTIYVRLNEHVQARTYLEGVLQRAPQQSFARRLLVSSYLASGDAPRALQTLQPLLDGGEADAGVLELAGQTYLANGDLEKAQSYFSRAVAGAPDDPMARTRLGVSRLAGGDIERAFADLEAASDMEGSAGQADLALILAHLQRRDFDKALDAQKALEAKQPNNPGTFNLKGGILLAKRDFPGARAAFEKAFGLKPDFVAALINLSRLDLADKQPEVAKARFEGVIKANPGNSDVLLAYAEFLRVSGSPAAEVLAVLERAAAAAPAALQPQLALGQHHLRAGEPAKALAVAQKTVVAHPNEAQGFHMLARAQLAVGDREQAIASLNKVAGLQPQSPVPHVQLAEVMHAMGNDAGAEQALRKALAIQPAYLEAQQRLIALLSASKRSDEAFRVARTVKEQRPTAPAGYLLEGDLLGAAGKWTEAAAQYRQALERQKSGEVIVRLHSALSKAGRKAEADKLTADWMREQPRDVVVRGYVAERALADKRYDEALRLFRAMNEIVPDSALILNNLAWTAGQVRDPQALTYAERAATLAPDNAAVLDTLGMLQIENGQTDKGMANLSRAVSLAPESLPLRINLARAHIKGGRKDEARKELEAVLAKVQPGTPAHAEVSALLAGL